MLEARFRNAALTQIEQGYACTYTYLVKSQKVKGDLIQDSTDGFFSTIIIIYICHYYL